MSERGIDVFTRLETTPPAGVGPTLLNSSKQTWKKPQKASSLAGGCKYQVKNWRKLANDLLSSYLLKDLDETFPSNCDASQCKRVAAI